MITKNKNFIKNLTFHPVEGLIYLSVCGILLRHYPVVRRGS